MAVLAVTAIGADRPGIVAAVASVLHERDGNVEDSAMTILGGNFAIVLLVSTDDEPEELRAALAEATAHLSLTVAVTPAGPGHAAPQPTHVLSVYGADRPGILAGVTAALADLDIDITDLDTRILGEHTPVYAMVLELAVEPASREGDVAGALDRVCRDLGVDHTLRPLSTETY